MTFPIESRGSGCDLVLVHGWAMHGGIFAPLVEQLATHFRVHVVDLPGHGMHHAFTPGALDPTACARELCAQLPPAIWIGWSLGGLVALQAGLDRPDHVRGLVAIASSPRFVVADDWAHGVEASVFAEFANALETRFEHAIERFLALETLGSPHAHDELRALKQQVFAHGQPSAAALREGLAVLADTDRRAALAQLQVPSLWIAGRRDRLVPPAAMRWAALQAPRAEFLELPAGHAPFLSHAGEVSAAIVRFGAAVPA